MPVTQHVGAAPIQITGWGWRHAGRKAPAISDINLDIAPGERVLVVGASGAGKSTLVSGIAGVLGDDEDGEATGELLVAGVSPQQQRGLVGLVIQDPTTQVLLERVGDDVAFGCENLGIPRTRIWPKVTEALSAVGLDVPLDHRTAELSGGQQQRLALAGVLAMAPAVIVLDEPTANLDTAGAAALRDTVAALPADKHTLVIVEHRIDLWLDVATRMVVIGHGGIVADGIPCEVIADKRSELQAAGVWVPDAEIPKLGANQAPTDNSPILWTEHLVTGYAEAISHELDYAFTPGTCTALIGPNGAGKSTLALTLAGLIKPIAGDVNSAMPARGRSNPLKWRPKDIPGRIGFVFQRPAHQFITASVHAELELAKSLAHSQTNIDDVLVGLGLTNLMDVHPMSLSGGEQRRLSVATALAAAPKVVVLDEPTFGQDYRTWNVLVKMLANLRDSGTAIIMVTHDQALLQALAPRIIEVNPL